jgi:hypothetical protein
MWVLAVALDYAGPYFLGAAGWKLVPEHFAERFGLIVIIALGESIVAIGAGVTGDVTVGIVTAAIVGVTLPRGGSRASRTGASRTRRPGTPTDTCIFRSWQASSSWRSG